MAKMGLEAKIRRRGEKAGELKTKGFSVNNEVNRNDTKAVVSKLNTGNPEHIKGTNKKNRQQQGGIMGDRVLMVLASKEPEMAREEGGTVSRIAQWLTPSLPCPAV